MIRDTHPRPCVICTYYMSPDEAPPAKFFSPGIGRVCPDCAAHAAIAASALMSSPGIAPHMIPDGSRNANPAKK